MNEWEKEWERERWVVNGLRPQKPGTPSARQAPTHLHRLPPPNHRMYHLRRDDDGWLDAGWSRPPSLWPSRKDNRVGKSQRTKGHDWERQLATYFREWFPGRVVRRSQQGDRAYEPDVVVDLDVKGGELDLGWRDPSILWPECISSNKPQVFQKLEQAIRDVEAAGLAYKIPCVFAKRTQGKGTNGYEVVVMRVEDFAKFAGWT